MPTLARVRVHLQKFGAFSRPYLTRAGADSPYWQGFLRFWLIRGHARNFGSQPISPYRNLTVPLARARVVVRKFGTAPTR